MTLVGQFIQFDSLLILCWSSNIQLWVAKITSLSSPTVWQFRQLTPTENTEGLFSHSAMFALSVRTVTPREQKKTTIQLIIHVRGGRWVEVYNLFTFESLKALKGTARVPTASETWKGDVTRVPEASPLVSLSPATTSEVYLSSCLSSQRLLNPAMEHRHV